MRQLIEETEAYPIAPCSDSRIAICGAGTLGGNLAEALARRGFRRLTIIDQDWVEEQNLTSQPFQPRDIGTPKALTLARALYGMAQVEADPVVAQLTTDNAAAHLAGSRLVVDALDNAAGRNIVAEACARLDLPCLHLSVEDDGEGALVAWMEDATASGGEREEHLPPRPLVELVVSASCDSIVRFLITGEKLGGKVAIE